jgi:Tfp pilus assembly protein PilN
MLPPAYKENIVYARRNRSLLKWSVALIIALAVMGLIIAGGYIFMDQSIKRQSAQSEEARQNLKNEKLEETKARLDEISSNTKLALQVLSREILFSELLRQLGASLPAGTTLQSINIDKIEGGITLKALATDIESATQIQVNLADPENKIFQKADIETINCSSTSGENSSAAYPCTVQIRALFAKDNPYVYISDTSNAQGDHQ